MVEALRVGGKVDAGNGNGMWALITGASSGIGRELARIMAKENWNLVLTARRESELLALAASLKTEYGASVKVVAADLGEPGAVPALVGVIRSQGLELSALVNNAGFGLFGSFCKTDWKTEGAMIDLNIRALTELTKALLPGMLARGNGRIMNVASTAAFQPGPGMAVYFATKAYALHFSEALAHELKGTGLTVTALCPGGTASGFQAAAAMENSAMVKGKKLPSSREVALFGYRAMMKGKPVAVHGMLNRLMAASIRFAPRRMVTAITARMMGAR